MVTFVSFILTYSHGENILDKFTKISAIDISLECFADDFSQFFSATIKIWLLDG